MTAERKLSRRVPVGSAQPMKGKLEGDIEVSITLCFGTECRADLDNFIKLSLDALPSIAYLADSEIAKLSIGRAHDKARPRIEIIVR
jgi:Holliday junction resolvase RusA-like endonuclease